MAYDAHSDAEAWPWHQTRGYYRQHPIIHRNNSSSCHIDWIFLKMRIAHHHFMFKFKRKRCVLRTLPGYLANHYI